MGKLDEPAWTRRLDELLPPNPAVTTDWEYLLNRLANSLSLNAERKQATCRSLPSWSQQRIDELLTAFEGEQKHFESLLEEFPEKVFGWFHQCFSEWGGIVLDDETGGWRRYLYAPLEGEILFAHAESWPEYWLGLTQGLIAQMRDREAANQAIERAETAADRPEILAEQLLELDLPETTPAETRHWFEERARRLAPGHSWLDFLAANRLMQAPEPNPARAERLLTLCWTIRPPMSTGACAWPP